MSQTVRPVVTSGTVAAGGVLISAVNGTAFIDVDTSKTGGADFSAALLAAVANNDVIEITSVRNKQKIIGYAKAAGSAETLGDETVTGWTNQAFETFTASGLDISEATETGTNGRAISNLLTTGALYKYGFTATLLDGSFSSAIYYNKNSGHDLSYSSVGDRHTITAGANSGYGILCSSGTYSGYVGWRAERAISFAITDYTNKQVLTPSAAGITITNSPNGATYNFGLLSPTFVYNDAAGYTYRILSSGAYGTLIATEAPVSGTLHIATVNGGAMFFHDSIDFSSYAGNDTDTTKYLFVFYDSTGKSAQAYAGAVGGGEALDGELVTNGDMELDSDWIDNNSPTSNTRSNEQAHGGTYSRKIIGNNSTGARQTVTHEVGKLYKFVGNIYVSAGSAKYTYRDVYSSSSAASWAEKTIYGTASTTGHGIYLESTATAATAYFDDISLKALTDIPATGLHLLSTKNGSTRNMKSVESGFNANAITRLNIYRAL